MFCQLWHKHAYNVIINKHAFYVIICGFITCHLDIPPKMTRKPSYTLPLFGPSMTESLKSCFLGHLFDNLEGGKHAFLPCLAHIGV